MKKILVITTVLILTASCDKKEEVDCSAISCFGGDIVELEFLRNSQNILETEPSTKILITQNDQTADFSVNTVKNSITIFLYDDEPLKILVEDQELSIEIESVLVEGSCCSGIQVNELTTSGISLCTGETCDEIISINLD